MRETVRCRWTSPQTEPLFKTQPSKTWAHPTAKCRHETELLELWDGLDKPTITAGDGEVGTRKGQSQGLGAMAAAETQRPESEPQNPHKKCQERWHTLTTPAFGRRRPVDWTGWGRGCRLSLLVKFQASVSLGGTWGANIWGCSLASHTHGCVPAHILTYVCAHTYTYRNGKI